MQEGGFPSQFQRYNWAYGWSGFYGGGGGERRRKIFDAFWRPLVKSPARSFAVLCCTLFLLVCALMSTRLRQSSPTIRLRSPQGTMVPTTEAYKISKKPRKQIEIPLNCTDGNLTLTCPTNYYPRSFLPSEDLGDDQDRPSTCPDYFRWIYEDLRPWMQTGISREALERARRTANFRLVVVNGRAYVETYVKGFQSRDTFTLWGVLQLLRRYPGKVPDLELMFDCVDWPVVIAGHYRGPNATQPPPLFRYCKDHSTLDIVFPDWSFWGWPEINIKPWGSLLKDLDQGNKRTRWLEREPYAYWKGNPYVAATREDLLKCNVSETQEWNARIYAQDWGLEIKEGYKRSDLASQCVHRYKIYIEGSAWSVSEKYILACDSVTLLVKPRYYDFFSRGLMPVQHYWPIKSNDKCRSIKFAVDWGNNHKKKAHEIGKAAANFIQEELKMDFVYDYMFHLLSEYAKLLRFKPTVPPNATELCSEVMACPAEGFDKKFKLESLVKGPAEAGPCKMPPPFDARSLYAHRRRKENSINQVEMWESKYWENRTQQSK